MALDLNDCTFSGPALPEPFVKFELEDLLRKKGLLPKATGPEKKLFEESWDTYRRSLRALGEVGGSTRVYNHVLQPLIERLGYATADREPEVKTREGIEDGGWLLSTPDGSGHLRVWSVESGADMDAPNRRGRAYRFSPTQVACRILLQQRERVGLLTDGGELRLLVSDPAGRDSFIEVHLDRSGGWRGAREAPDSYRLIVALATPKGVAAVPDLVEAARLTQVRVTGKLREQARRAVEGFVQEVLDRPENCDRLAALEDRQALARALWHEGLILVYRLIFILKLESSPDPARAFGFASSSLWRNTWSPNVALARYVRLLLRDGKDTGRLLEDGLRGLFRIICEGLSARELPVKPLGGMLFGPQAMPVLTRLHWGERAVALLLDRLLWTPEGKVERRRVYYGSLDVEDLGRVYESLLELEPGLSAEPMCRLRRAKLEVVVPLAQGQRYRASTPVPVDPDAVDVGEPADDEGDEDEGRGKKTQVQWIEEIPADRFFLRVGLGRKSSGSYYTPHSFVKFLVRETLEPLVAERSPMDDPRPAEILKLKVLDPAMGSGHFLVEVARFLGDKLYEACRLCDERALDLEHRTDVLCRAGSPDPASIDPAIPSPASPERDSLLAQARDLRARVEDLPDPEDELLAYLPSRAPEGEESGLSQFKALALCRRLVAVHCLYGVDKNPLAVELAKLSLWIEAHAEGLPLTFLDHRFVVGDSLTGPFFEHLLTMPGSQQPVQDIFRANLADRFSAALGQALAGVRDLEKSVGVDLADVEAKTSAKAALDRAMAPFRVVAAAWAGGVMLGHEQCDDQGYAGLLEVVARTGNLPENLADRPRLRIMIARGLGVSETPTSREDILALVLGGTAAPALPYDLAFPEVFHPNGAAGTRVGFDVVVGNPPWDRLRPFVKEFFGAIDVSVWDAGKSAQVDQVVDRLMSNASNAAAFNRYAEDFNAQGRVHDLRFHWQSVRVEDTWAGRGNADAYCLFAELAASLVKMDGRVGLVLPSGFHANEGATGVRRLYLRELALQTCYSFENKRKLFEIHASFKFAVVIAARTGPTTEFRCAFYLHEDEWLFESTRRAEELDYSADLVERSGGPYLTFLELRNGSDAAVADSCFQHSEPFGAVTSRWNIQFSVQADMTRDAGKFIPTRHHVGEGQDPRDARIHASLFAAGLLPLHEGKTFWQFDDHWEAPPRFLVSLGSIVDKKGWLLGIPYFRLAFRGIASATNERTAIFSVLPPGVICGNSAPLERNPQGTPRSTVLVLGALGNSFTFDWTLRVRAASNVNQFILNSCPLPVIARLRRFLRSGALRLTCNHAGYAPLWHEQLGQAWRELGKPFSAWPVLVGDDSRWEVRAAIDAVVAEAYGLSRDQYEHVLSTFSHKSYPKAPALCLAAFDELKQIGLDAFTKKHDPYWDIPLNESLPKPVIDLPIGTGAVSHASDAAGEAADSGTEPKGRPVQTSLFDDPGPLFRRS